MAPVGAEAVPGYWRELSRWHWRVRRERWYRRLRCEWRTGAEAGNTSGGEGGGGPTELTVTIDGPTATAATSAELSFDCSASEGCTFQCSVNEATPADCQSPFVLAVPDPGTYVLTVFASTGDGRQAESSAATGSPRLGHQPVSRFPIIQETAGSTAAQIAAALAWRCSACSARSGAGFPLPRRGSPKRRLFTPI